MTTRWPVFAAALAEQTDVRALFALPLQLGAINVGVIDLYRTARAPYAETNSATSSLRSTRPP